MPTYTVSHERLTIGELRNRDQVENALLEGRVIPPVVEYHDYTRGQSVELDADRAKSLLASGAIEGSGDSGDGLDSLKKDELESLAEANGVDLSDASNNAERVQALRDAGVTADS
jgi:hypothetical protein